MEFWETTKYAKWYSAHRRFSFTAKYCIEQYEDGKPIPKQIFQPFLKSLSCHSKSEEKMFAHMNLPSTLFDEHQSIQPAKVYTNEEKYTLCKNLLSHMKEEEQSVMKFLNTIK